jgi:plasmid replication initiation protein
MVIFMSNHNTSERTALEVFRALPGDLAARDVQDLMTYSFFSLAKSKRVVPIHYRSGDVTICVEGTHEHGIATIWDADILIWVASQLIEARDHGLSTSRLMRVTPYEVLKFIGRGTSLRDYQRFKAALDRLQSTTIATSLRQTSQRRLHRFSWINEWKEHIEDTGRVRGIELILPDWFYSALMEDRLVLRINTAYFHLTGGIERWLYRLVRKHGGHQRNGWRFDFQHLYLKSGSLMRYANFALELRDIVRRQGIPDYFLKIERSHTGKERLWFSMKQRPSLRTLMEELTIPLLSGDNL